MAESITCNYARFAICLFTTKYKTKKHTLPRGAYSQILSAYNEHFSDYPALKTTYGVAVKKFLSITKVFGNKWHPTHSKKEFLTSFSIEQWSSIEASEKAAHTLRACKICQTKHPALSQSFPLRSSKHKKLKSPEINFTPQDLSNLIQFGSKLLKEADSICQTQFQVCPAGH